MHGEPIGTKKNLFCFQRASRGFSARPSRPTHKNTPRCAFDASIRQRSRDFPENRPEDFRFDARKCCAFRIPTPPARHGRFTDHTPPAPHMVAQATMPPASDAMHRPEQVVGYAITSRLRTLDAVAPELTQPFSDGSVASPTRTLDGESGVLFTCAGRRILEGYLAHARLH